MDWSAAFSALPSSELDKLAILRVIECTNGVIQNLYREGSPDALSVDETRQAMKFSMSCIKSMAIPMGDQQVTFCEPTAGLFTEIRRLYISGAKNNNTADWAEFLRASEANLRAIGLERIEAAKREIFYHIYDLPPHTLDWGVDYIKGFIGARI
ncbi:hypothetical protein [Cyanobium sp. WAJ14-Wanaka]|uniref:hypothetical protein n=1 Tax=Cyanobium sp. WAJ14-Wanaka TaxID=2823725 RepID=UPI0020CCFCFE|nr:hypothetical protein [Cyanobium sp. WAJ14-Wanaka]MCP9775989.1 hypothetical protein [Cyanobium sp. WAJ14-Wanaka]